MGIVNLCVNVCKKKGKVSLIVWAYTPKKLSAYYGHTISCSKHVLDTWITFTHNNIPEVALVCEQVWAVCYEQGEL